MSINNQNNYLFLWCLCNDRTKFNVVLYVSEIVILQNVQVASCQLVLEDDVAKGSCRYLVKPSFVIPATNPSFVITAG